jgi:HAE1 family hydrophobic/amphiphilic exporter-1
VRDQISEPRAELGNNTTITTIFDQAPLIEQSIHDLAIEGCWAWPSPSW